MKSVVGDKAEVYPSLSQLDTFTSDELFRLITNSSVLFELIEIKLSPSGQAFKFFISSFAQCNVT